MRFQLVTKVFKILTILNVITLLGYVIFSWNDSSDKSLLTMQMLMAVMFIFGGIDNLCSEQKSMKMIGVLYFFRHRCWIVDSVPIPSYFLSII